MLFKSWQERILFAPNGFWSRTCYVLPNEGFKSRLKWLGRASIFLIIVIFLVAATLDDWLVLIIGIPVTIFLQIILVNFLCRNCEKVKEKITYRDAILEFSKDRKISELWLAAVTFPALVIFQLWNVSKGTEDIVWDVLALLLFMILSHFSIYAIKLRKEA